jgi:pimeloyl-ACP methyl ester carboxylesterase
MAWVALGGVMSAISGTPHPRGVMVDIGGRRLRIVCEGPRGVGPSVILEAGAYGLGSDWAAVQARLRAEGVRSCAYDRAGMGYSDPGPEPRDGIAIAADLEKLLDASGERPPYVLVGHSMAGLRIWLYARRHPADVAGLVFVDESTPDPAELKASQFSIARLAGGSRLAALAAQLGLLKPLRPIGDRIGLPPLAAAEKRWAFVGARQNETGSQEVQQWVRTAEQAAATGPLSPDLPVAVVTAGRHARDREAFKAAPALKSRRGYYVNIPDAEHATLLGERHAASIVKGIDFVRAAAEEQSGSQGLALLSLHHCRRCGGLRWAHSASTSARASAS